MVLDRSKVYTADKKYGQRWRVEESSKLHRKFLGRLLKRCRLAGVMDLFNDCIFTNESMKKWRFKCDDTSCAFYDAFETWNHLFFQCSIAQRVWDLCCTVGRMNWFPRNTMELIDCVVSSVGTYITNLNKQDLNI